MTDDFPKLGKPHTLIVYSLDLPIEPFYDGVLDYDIEHPEECQLVEHTEGEIPWSEYKCDIQWNIDAVGLEFCLNHSGTPIKEPGTYQIQSWIDRTYHWECGYEYDSGIGVIDSSDSQ